MAHNTYLVAVRTFGYKTAATAAAFYQGIDPVVGGRLVVMAFGLTVGGPVASKAYFMKPLNRTTVNGAVASGATTVIFTAQPGIVGNLFASGDMVCIKLSNGTYQHVVADNWNVTTLTAVITTALTAAISTLAPVWNYGVYTDNGHFQYKLTVSTQNTKDVVAGIFACDAIYDPMVLYMLNASGSQIDTIDYLTVDAINS
jgi:hypothetical protein